MKSEQNKNRKVGRAVPCAPKRDRRGALGETRPTSLPENRAILDTRRRGLRGAWTVGTAALLVGFFILHSTFFIPAATVVGYENDVHQLRLSDPIVFTPTNSVTFRETNLYAGPPKIVRPTNGFFSTVLEAGNYTVLIRPRAPFMITVPNSTNSYNIGTLNPQGATFIGGGLLYDDGTNAGGLLLFDP